jgi:hypothetical protein
MLGDRQTDRQTDRQSGAHIYSPQDFRHAHNFRLLDRGLN